MALYRRLIGLDEPKIAVHSLMALLAEHLGRSQLTRAQVDIVLGLDTAEQSELTVLLGTFTGNVIQKLARAIELHDVLILAESSTLYNTEVILKARLGV